MCAIYKGYRTRLAGGRKGLTGARYTGLFKWPGYALLERVFTKYDSMKMWHGVFLNE